MTSIIQRIEAALSSNDLHAGEIVGLITAATATAARLENLIAKLAALRDAVVAQENAALLQKPASLYHGWENEPDRRQRSR
jgi:hypothetical protein